MVKVLWVSRHNMTPEQLGALEKKLGPVEIRQVDRTLSSAFELKDEVEDSDVIAIVAPVNLQQQFLRIAGDKPVIMAKSERIIENDPEGGESKVVFKFLKWERLVKIEVVLEDFA